MRKEDKTDRELLEAVLDGQRNLESKMDAIEEQLKRLTHSQDVLVKEIHQNKVDIDLLKKNNQAS